MISFVGAAAAAGISVALPAHQARDFILAFAYRDGSNAAPTIPAGWTAIGNSGGNTNGSRIAYKRAASAAEVSGNWTNATELLILVYRSDTSIVLVGSFAGAGASSGVIQYPALGLHRADGTSWVVGVAGHRTASDLATNPPGMLNRITVGAQAVGKDTNGPVSSWDLQTTAVNAVSGWRSWTLELKEAQFGDWVQAAYLDNPGSPAVGAMDAAVVAGHLLVVAHTWAGIGGAPTILDSQGNLWAEAVRHNRPGDDRAAALWVAIAQATGINTVTVTVPGSAREAIWAEYHGPFAEAPLDVVAHAEGVDAAPSSGLATPTVPGALLLGYVVSALAGGVFTPGAGFALDVAGAPATSALTALERRLLGAAVPVGVTGALAAPGAWTALLAAFKPVPGVGPAPTRRGDMLALFDPWGR